MSGWIRQSAIRFWATPVKMVTGDTGRASVACWDTSESRRKNPAKLLNLRTNAGPASKEACCLTLMELLFAPVGLTR